MNIYTPIAEFEMARQELLRAHAAISVEHVPERWKDTDLDCRPGVAHAMQLLDAARDHAAADVTTLRAWAGMTPERLRQAIIFNFGHEVYLKDERPLARALIQMYAAMTGRQYEDVAMAMANQYDEERLGVHL